MNYNFPYLKDNVFLKEIDNMKVKEQFTKITVLDFQENPIQDIQGKVTSGNINIDGNSSMRRTCNLSMIADDESAEKLNSPSNLISLNKKIKIFQGITNTVKDQFPQYSNFDIIWFPLGLYVIVGCTISHGVDGVNLSLQLKDKMCLLNGEVGGTFPASIVFNEYDVDTSFMVELESSHAVSGEYADETVKTSEKNVTKLEGDKDYTLMTTGVFTSKTETEIFQPTIYQIIQEVVNHFGGEQLGKIIISDVPLRAKMIMKWVGSQPLYGSYYKGGSGAPSYLFTLRKSQYEKSLSGNPPDTPPYSSIPNDNPGAQKGVFTSGDNIGYIYTDFTYPKELSANAGDNVCSVLDQIVQTLGNFEYFYDVEGNFIFQEKKNYLNTSQATIELKNMAKPDYLVDMSKGKSTYIFDDSTLINSYSSAPQYNMIKNDFLVWGIRETVDGKTLPCRYHLAIDDKPDIGNKYEVAFYEDANDGIIKTKVPVLVADESELSRPGLIGVLYAVGDYHDIRYWSVAAKDYVKIPGANIQEITTKDWRSELYLSGTMAGPLATDTNYYYSELMNEWPKLYDVMTGNWIVGTNPTDLDYFLDFIDDASVSDFSIASIGRRQKVVNDNEINCLFEPRVEEVVFIKNNPSTKEEEVEMKELRQECENNSIPYVQVEGAIYDSLAAGKEYNSAYAYARDLLYQYTSYNEAITLSTIPIYYLDVNCRITVRDKESGIFGDYNINSISVPLDVQSFMNINASKVIERA